MTELQLLWLFIGGCAFIVYIAWSIHKAPCRCDKCPHSCESCPFEDTEFTKAHAEFCHNYNAPEQEKQEEDHRTIEDEKHDKYLTYLFECFSPQGRINLFIEYKQVVSNRNVVSRRNERDLIILTSVMQNVNYQCPYSERKCPYYRIGSGICWIEETVSQELTFGKPLCVLTIPQVSDNNQTS